MKRYLVQVGLTLASATIVVLVWGVTGYRGPANLLAMLVPPIAIGLVANEGLDRRTFMALTLIIIHCAAVSILGVLAIGY